MDWLVAKRTQFSSYAQSILPEAIDGWSGFPRFLGDELSTICRLEKYMKKDEALNFKAASSMDAKLVTALLLLLATSRSSGQEASTYQCYSLKEGQSEDEESTVECSSATEENRKCVILRTKLADGKESLIKGCYDDHRCVFQACGRRRTSAREVYCGSSSHNDQGTGQCVCYGSLCNRYTYTYYNYNRTYYHSSTSEIGHSNYDANIFYWGMSLAAFVVTSTFCSVLMCCCITPWSFVATIIFLVIFLIIILIIAVA